MQDEGKHFVLLNTNSSHSLIIKDGNNYWGMPLIVKIRCNANDDKSGHEVQLLLTWPTLNDLLCCIASCPSFAQCHVIQQSECRTAGSTDFFNFVFNQEHFSWTVHPLQVQMLNCKRRNKYESVLLYCRRRGHNNSLLYNYSKFIIFICWV